MSSFYWNELLRILQNVHNIGRIRCQGIIIFFLRLVLCLLIRFQDFLLQYNAECWKMSTFDYPAVHDDLLNVICDVFRWKPYNTHSSFVWSNEFYNTIATLKLDDVEGFRWVTTSRWNFYFYMSGLPNMSMNYDFNCNANLIVR